MPCDISTVIEIKSGPLDLANDWQVGNDGEQRRPCDKDKRIVERSGALHNVSNDDRRGNTRHIATLLVSSKLSLLS